MAIDPGSSKCGVAVCNEKDVLYHKVIKTEDLKKEVSELKEKFKPEVLVIGNGTYCEKILEKIKNLVRGKIVKVDEAYTTLEARNKYFEFNPPRGIKRFLPRTFLYPSVDYDDFVAIILAERYIKKEVKK